MNKIFILGFTGADPEVKTVGNSKVANFTVATTERGYKTKEGKEVPEVTEWHRVVIWGGLATVVENYVKKGTQVLVEGKITYRSYEKDGVKQYITEIKGENITLLGKPEKKSNYSDKVQDALDDLPFS